MRPARLAALPLAGLLLASPAAADPILYGPSSPMYNAGLGTLSDAYQRQMDVFATLEIGIELDPVFNASAVPTVQAFFAQSATNDYQQFSGMHPYLAMSTYQEYEDEGNFGGIASVGVAARLMVLEAQGAPAADIAAARAAAVFAAQTWHIYGSIAGSGVLARGVERITPWNPGDPPFPGTVPMLTPLEDAMGNPLPTVKSGVWRAPVANDPSYIWTDDTSKDQVSGYALAVAWLWDALHDDPNVPASVTADLAADLVAFAKALMVVAPEYGIDLCIRDADGRLTDNHDLNPRQIDPDSVIPADFPVQNGFNAAMALAVIRAAYHVSGDPVVGKYYYDELVGRRNYPSLAVASAGLIFTGVSTNYSNVNMLAISLAILGRFETDPYVRAELGSMLDTQFWSTGDTRDVSHVQQAWFDAVYGAYAPSPPETIRTRIPQNLGEFQTPPAFERTLTNCDAAAIDAGTCVGVDGTTMITLESMPGHDGELEAVDIVPKNIRPDSDFEWRSDPHRVNGTGSTTMDSGGDWLTAYWLSRASDLENTSLDISPYARPPLPYTLDGGAGGGGAGGGGTTTSSSSSSSTSSSGSANVSGGCSACDAVGAPPQEALAAGAGLLALLGAVGRRRRR